MRAVAVAIVLLLLVSPSFAMTADEAEKAAFSWLALVDAGKYADSWNEAGPLFKSRVTRDTWVKNVRAAREPFGGLADRKIGDIKLTKNLPGAPDGDYAVVQFHAIYAKKQDAVETVTLASEDGRLAVIGYFIR